MGSGENFQNFTKICKATNTGNTANIEKSFWVSNAIILHYYCYTLKIKIKRGVGVFYTASLYFTWLWFSCIQDSKYFYKAFLRSRHFCINITFLSKSCPPHGRTDGWIEGRGNEHVKGGEYHPSSFSSGRCLKFLSEQTLINWSRAAIKHWRKQEFLIRLSCLSLLSLEDPDHRLSEIWRGSQPPSEVKHDINYDFKWWQM